MAQKPALSPRQAVRHSLQRKRRSRFNAQKTQIYQYKCDSQAEAAYIALKIEEQADPTGSLLTFLFHPKFHFRSGLTWEADLLEFLEGGIVRVVDVKSPATLATQAFRLKMLLMAEEYPELGIWIVQRSSAGQWSEERYHG